MTLTTNVVSEKRVDLRYVLGESLTVVDGWDLGVKEEEKSNRNLIYELMTET